MGRIIFYMLSRPQWEKACLVLDTGAGVRVKLGCLLFIAGLCFGQFIEPSMSHKFHQRISTGWGINQSSELSNSMMYKLSFYRNPAQFNPMLMVQVEGDSLKPKTSFWKQAGIYGLEFVGAAMGSVVSICFGDLSAGSWWGSSDYSLIRGFVVYSITNTLFTSSCTWGLGKLLGQKGTWWKSAVGSGIGALTGFTSAYLSRKKGEFTEVGIVFLLTTPTIGAVLGYNKK
ncbi:MAG: hypothetical protein ABIL40_11490 [candidate division WOR-3 bacterium]